MKFNFTLYDKQELVYQFIIKKFYTQLKFRTLLFNISFEWFEVFVA
jgi:hypothetical protein